MSQKVFSPFKTKNKRQPQSGDEMRAPKFHSQPKDVMKIAVT